MSVKIHYRIITILLLLVTASMLSPARLAAAQAPQPTPSDNDVNRVARQLYCPVCENIPLDVCPTTACAEWRDMIRQKLAAGWSDQRIKDYFAAQFGDRVLAEPPRRGLNWLVYVLPPIFFLGGAAIVYYILRQMRRAPAGAASAPSANPAEPGGGDPYLDQVEEELKKRN